ncbi:MAG: deoxyhypusine synthase [Candidatus Altiarchaeota archaeon]|nr:deoxyhypusine synthase [Candidatus Altiarchaeota archaeon]
MIPPTDKVKDFKLKKDMTVNELLVQMYASGGFTAKKLGVAAEILKEMVTDKASTNFFSFPACINATGTRGAILEAIKQGWFKVLIGTCGTLDHDIGRLFANYHHGSFMMDDNELRHKKIYRLGNVLVPEESYGPPIEDFLQKMFKEMGDRELGTHELVWEMGKQLRNHPKKEESLLYWIYKQKIPFIIPGPYDGAVGYQLWLYQQDHNLKLDLTRDEKLLSDIVFSAKKTGALMVGGGISKHHTIWWNQFRDGLDYAVYLTTAVEHDGSLSGARMREAVSWNKVREDAKYVTVEGDATITLPILLANLL